MLSNFSISLVKAATHDVQFDSNKIVKLGYFLTRILVAQRYSFTDQQ